VSVAQERFYELDLFRFLAAMSVVFFHYTFRGFTAGDLSILSFPELGEVSRYGYLGVDFFFMISGFVILMSAIGRDAYGFAISRIVRLYPAFWMGVTLTTLFIVVLGREKFSVEWWQYLANLTMVGGYVGIKPVDGVYWTLLVEIKFYLIIFVLLVFNLIHRIKFILWGWLLMSFVANVVAFPSVVNFFLFPEWAAYFIAGAMFYLSKKEGISVDKLVAIALCFILSVLLAFERLTELESYFEIVFSRTFTALIIFGFYIVFFLISTDKLVLLKSKKMLFFGALTYPLYLIHQNIGFMLFNAFGEFANKYLVLGGVIGVMLLFSYLIHVHVEKRLSKPMKHALGTCVARTGLRKKTSHTG